ncbi:ATP-binding protein [Shewanella algae]|uniref:ATP-binding protein n=1 Tax=Shewanella algae TaxID=38313 RepID=UPI0038B31C8D
MQDGNSNKNFVEFRVSAKTARLIGRESISSAEGAIIELVKNSYDADAKECQIFILSKYEQIPNFLPSEEFLRIKESLSVDNEISTLTKSYELSEIDQSFTLKEKITGAARDILQDIFSRENMIIIADNGEGMTPKVIEEHWMTIGTNAKELSAVSELGRIKSGAKGIGRFALDKLGKSCEMRTSKFSEQACIWRVNWEDFESKDTLDQVVASLEILDFSFHKSLDEFIYPTPHLYDESSSSGTLICIGNLREFWPKARISRLFENLKSLLPPSEESDFKISLYADQHKDDFGELTYGDYNEFDWKLTAKLSAGKAELTFYPAEYDRAEFDYDFFETNDYLDEPLFSKEEFIEGKYSKTINIETLIPNSDNNPELKQTLESLGDFEFSAYFLKKSSSNDERLKYFYKSVNQSLRNKWLSLNGGVKIYRDRMRVRPYGIGANFDWLKLDERAAASPAAPNRKGQWRVRAHQLAGVAHISRLQNAGILDQSNREGLIDNDYLAVFKNLLTYLVKELEYQRSFVASILDKLYKKKNEEEQIVELSKNIIKSHKPVNKNKGNVDDMFSSNEKSDEGEKLDVLVQHAKIQDEKIDNLTEENKLLRVLASSGAMIASFAHDFKKMSNNLSARHKKLIKVLQLFDIDTSKFDPSLNPFSMIADMEQQDDKLNAWLKLTLDTLKQDRRKSKVIILEDYFETLYNFWEAHLSSRNARLEFIIPKDSAIKCFEIELDAIFNNLISNSYEAFKRLGFQGEKLITISVIEEAGLLDFSYKDTGPGLSNSIPSPNKIFEPLFTTKTDSQGNTIGTGLGMSLVKGSIDDLGGKVSVLSKPGEHNFSVKIVLPSKVTR